MLSYFFLPLNDFVTVFPNQTHNRPNLTCRKIGQGQSRVIIYTNFVELDSPMLHAKFQDNRSLGSGEEDFLRFLTYMGVAAILVIRPAPFI